MTELSIDISARDVETPNPGGQTDFCNDWEHRFIALEGGWGSGKTWAGSRHLVVLHLHNGFDDDGHPTMVPHVAIAPTYLNAKDFVVPALMDACEKAGLDAVWKVSDMNIVFPDPACPLAPIMVRTAEHPERITGWEVGGAWGDEPSRWKSDRHNPANDPFIQLLGRVRHPKAELHQFIFTYTNEGDHTRIYEEFHSGKPTHALYRAATTDNPLVSDFYRAQSDFLSPELKLQYLEGEAISIRGGRVYTGYDYNDHVDDALELVADAPLHLSLDFNISPGMHGEVGQYNESADVFTVVHELYGDRLDVVGLIDMFGALIEELGGWKWPELHVFGDATEKRGWAGIGISCYEILRDGLTDLGIPFKFLVPKGNPPIVDRINAFNIALKDVKGDVHWKCHPRCARLIDDMVMLKRNEQGDVDKSEKHLSHATDAEGYRIHYLRPIRQFKPQPAGRFNV